MARPPPGLAEHASDRPPDNPAPTMPPPPPAPVFVPPDLQVLADAGRLFVPTCPAGCSFPRVQLLPAEQPTLQRKGGARLQNKKFYPPIEKGRDPLRPATTQKISTTRSEEDISNSSAPPTRAEKTTNRYKGFVKNPPTTRLKFVKNSCSRSTR